MNWLNMVWEWLLPDTEDVLVRGRAGLVIATGLGLTVAVVALILTWLASGDLQGETVVAGAIFVAVLAGLGTLARAGRATLAAWLLVILLTLLIAADVAAYGVASTASAGFMVPIVLAACGLGFWPGLGVAGGSSAMAWLLAGAENAGWYEPFLPPDISHLTFDAPALTVLFLLVALIVGLWTRHLLGIAASSRGRT